MDLTIRPKDNIRLISDCSDGKLFTDVRFQEYGVFGIELYEQCGYIEIRKKQRQIKVFQFLRKSHKKEFNFDWWEDAEIVFTYNGNGKDK